MEKKPPRMRGVLTFTPVKVLLRFWSQFRLCSLTTQMVFGVGKVQMKFLHLLSTEASQSILLRCLSDPRRDPPDNAGSDRAAPPENTTLHFRGWNKQTFERDTLLEPQVLQDDCKVTSQAEHWRAEFRIRRDETDAATSFISSFIRPFIIPSFYSCSVLQTAEVPGFRSVLLKHLQSSSFSFSFRSKMAAGTSHISSSTLRTAVSYLLSKYRHSRRHGPVASGV